MLTMVMALSSTLVEPARGIRVGMKSQGERGGMRGRHKERGEEEGKTNRDSTHPPPTEAT
jgi:hypothetical protein